MYTERQPQIKIEQAHTEVVQTSLQGVTTVQEVDEPHTRPPELMMLRTTTNRQPMIAETNRLTLTNRQLTPEPGPPCAPKTNRLKDTAPVRKPAPKVMKQVTLDGAVDASNGLTRKQHTEMVLSSFVLTEEETLKLSELQEQWNGRSQVWKQLTSPGWQALQYRWLELLVISEDEREEEFDRRRDAIPWAYASAAQYWCSMLKACEILGKPVSATMRAKAKLLAILAKEEDPLRPTESMTSVEALAIAAMLPERLALALLTAFALGQRIGDTMKVSQGALAQIEDKWTGTTFLAITYKRGKTTRRRQPFALHLPVGTRQAAPNPLASNGQQQHPPQAELTAGLSERLLRLEAERSVGKAANSHRQGEKATELLFTSVETLEADAELMRACIKKVNEKLCLLSVRRGGLQSMALAGATEATLLHHSRHPNPLTLQRYLGWGQLTLHAARERFAEPLHGTAASLQLVCAALYSLTLHSKEEQQQSTATITHGVSTTALTRTLA